MTIPLLKDLKRISEKSLMKYYFEFYDYLIKNYPNDISFVEKVYWYYNGITKYPTCKNCGKRVNFKGFNKGGYYNYCSLQCSNNSDEVKNKKQKTSIEKYGSIEYAYASRMEKTKKTLIEKYGSIEDAYASRMDKIKLTNLERYGVEYNFASDNNKEKTKKTLIEKYGSIEDAYASRMDKIKLTNLERYGVEYNLSNLDIRKKIKLTNLERYGVEYAGSSNIIKEKIKNTCLERYGVENIFQSDKFKENSKKTHLEKYGVEYAQQNAEIVKKSNNTKLNNFLIKHPDIITINKTEFETIFTCKCPHNECTKCKEKCYECTSCVYDNRRRKSMELCTKLLPAQCKPIKDTSLELFIQNILNENNIKYIKNDRSILGLKELDIYIPSNNIAIECNGIYWHSTINKDNTYHINKYNKCKSVNIRLISIWEDQIINKPNIVKSIILSNLNIFEKTINAKNCDIKETDRNIANIFLEKNHLYGKSNSSIFLGLYYKNELVYVMSFRKQRKSKNNKLQYELCRICNKLNYNIIDAEKIVFDYFVSKYSPKSIIAVSNNDIDDVKKYLNLGFKQKDFLQSYCFVDYNNLNRYSKSNNCNQSYYKIYNTGKTKYEFLID